MPKISQARKDARREQILAAAMRLFARQGFHETTMPEICAEAGLSVGAVYSYFDSKKAIISALFEEGRRRTADLADHGQGPPAQRLRAFLGELERPGRELVDQVDVRALAEAIGDEQFRARYAENHAAFAAALAPLAKAAAVESNLDADALADLTAAVVVGMQVRKAIAPSADVGVALDAFVALLTGYRAAR